MATHGDLSKLVPVATAGSVCEAEIACNELREAGIDCFIPNATSSMVNVHMFHLINPSGVEVLVRAGDLGRARKALGLPRHVRKPFINAAKSQELRGPDQLAQRAALLSLFVGFFPPLVIWVLGYVVRAMVAAQKSRPEKLRSYRLNLFCAICFSVGLSGAMTLFFWESVAGFLSTPRY